MATRFTIGDRKKCFDVFQGGEFHEIIGKKLNVRRDETTLGLVVVELPIEIDDQTIQDSDRWMLFEMTTGTIIEKRIDGWLAVRTYITNKFDEIVKYLNSPKGHADAEKAFVYRLKQSEAEYAALKARYIRDNSAGKADDNF